MKPNLKEIHRRIYPQISNLFGTEHTAYTPPLYVQELHPNLQRSIPPGIGTTNLIKWIPTAIYPQEIIPMPPMVNPRSKFQIWLSGISKYFSPQGEAEYLVAHETTHVIQCAFLQDQFPDASEEYFYHALNSIESEGLAEVIATLHCINQEEESIRKCGLAHIAFHERCYWVKSIKLPWSPLDIERSLNLTGADVEFLNFLRKYHSSQDYNYPDVDQEDVELIEEHRIYCQGFGSVIKRLSASPPTTLPTLVREHHDVRWRNELQERIYL